MLSHTHALPQIMRRSFDLPRHRRALPCVVRDIRRLHLHARQIVGLKFKVELGPANILSNGIMPGAVMTEHNLKQIPAEQREQIRQHLPTRQLITPEDVAAVIVFLGSPVNTQIIGEIIRVTGERI